MFESITIVVVCVFLAFLTISVSYSVFLALFYFFSSEKKPLNQFELKKYLIIIPSHNEELIIDGLCKNLKKINYDKKLYEIVIVADNCSDKTSDICIKNGYKVLERYDDNKKGKGYAINYAFENLKLEKFDYIMILDADTYVDENILYEISKALKPSDVALQCYIKIPNRNESWFTELLYVSRVINGLFYHYPKYKLGLSSYLMGSGICFSTDLIKKKGWTAFSIAEDWEYYAQIGRAHV